MLAYIGFIDWEEKLLLKVATELGVAERCEFRQNIDAFGDDGALVVEANGRQPFPAVIFLNMNAKAETWRQSLIALKAHRVLASVPVIGLGDLTVSDIEDVYNLGGNSYIPKPETFEEMAYAAKISLTFWLEISHLPKEHLRDLQ